MSDQKWIGIDSDPKADTWYHWEQTAIFEVMNEHANGFTVWADGEAKFIPKEDCRLITTVSEFLNKQRVCEFYIDEDNPRRIVAEEKCDNYFRVKLPASSVRRFAAELIELAKAVESK